MGGLTDLPSLAFASSMNVSEPKAESVLIASRISAASPKKHAAPLLPR